MDRDAWQIKARNRINQSLEVLGNLGNDGATVLPELQAYATSLFKNPSRASQWDGLFEQVIKTIVAIGGRDALDIDTLRRVTPQSLYQQSLQQKAEEHWKGVLLQNN